MAPREHGRASLAGLHHACLWGRGLSYYLYWGSVTDAGLYQEGKKTSLADSAAVLNHEMAALSPALMKLESLGVYQSAPLPIGAEAVPETSPVRLEGRGELVLGLFGGGGTTATAFMVVNRSHKLESVAALRLAPKVRRVEEYDRGSQRWKRYPFNASKGVLTVPLKPGDGRLFRFVR